MTRAGERVKGATSARQLSRHRWRSTEPERPSATAEVGEGVGQSLGRAKPRNRLPNHRGTFFSEPRISARLAKLAATPSMAGQSDAPLSNGMRANRGVFLTAPELHWQARRKGVGTEGTLRTPYQSAQFSADRAAGGCSHSPARLAGTVGTGSGPAAMQEIRALVATPARSQPGCGGGNDC